MVDFRNEGRSLLDSSHRWAAISWLHLLPGCDNGPCARQVSYDTYISVTLTALAVILAAVAILVGAAAIWGYQQISAQAASQAEKAVQDRIKTLLDESNLKAMIHSRVQIAADEVYRDMSMTTPERSADTRAVAAPYPAEDGEVS